MKATHHARFDIEPGGLQDMTCGVCTDRVTGVNRMQEFRPTYFTAEWTDGVLVEVRFWGPRLLQDGSLGKRELDYFWKKTRATGPVKYTDLPRSVASLLLSWRSTLFGLGRFGSYAFVAI